MRSERAEPVLPAHDLDVIRAFYQRLGFSPWFGPNARWTYEIRSRGELVLHFFAERELKVSENCSGCYLRVQDADALHREWAALNLPADGIPRVTGLQDLVEYRLAEIARPRDIPARIGPPKDFPWGREVNFIDLAGCGGTSASPSSRREVRGVST